jgi:peptidoglycan/xylan/chitin deacetylase (PgdA/CDA1 family)
MNHSRRIFGAVAFCAILLPALAAITAAAPTIVSLSFDDGTSDQLAASQILNQRGLKATFFIISGRIGTGAYYMTVDDLRSLQAAGHEIGGHTIDHLDLTTLSTSAAQHEVCDDRAALTGMGLNPIAFDYPFGQFNDDIIATVKGCGYASARSVRGIGCPGCVNAESIPPANLYAIRTPALLSSSTALGTLESMVTAAEHSGGGWLPIVMHNVCDGCAPDSISVADLATFADFLVGRAGLGTVVKTIGQVAAGIVPQNPMPSMASLSPASAFVRSPDLNLTATGSNFIPTSSVIWNGQPRATVFISPAQLRATLLPSDLETQTTANVAVFTPGPGGGTSAAVPFRVTLGPQADPAESAFLLHDFYAFPNPSRLGNAVTIRLQAGIADSVDVRIYDISGSPVNTGSPGSPRVLNDGNGKGLQYTYEYRWDVSNAGSGIYVYTITAKKSGQSDIREAGKIGVMR